MSLKTEFEATLTKVKPGPGCLALELITDQIDAYTGGVLCFYAGQKKVRIVLTVVRD